MLRGVRTVIVDEIHAVADDKRGSHLALTLARLDALVRAEQAGGAAADRAVRHGESPRGGRAPLSRRTRVIVNVGHRATWISRSKCRATNWARWRATRCGTRSTTALAALIRRARTTLVFVNTRRLSERVAHHLGERLGQDVRAAASRQPVATRCAWRRRRRLKSGELRAVVATASLELGIDIGTVDLVCQIGSPRSIAVALQRIGRSGHWVGAPPQGRLFATTRDELIECAALVRAIRRGELDRLEIPRHALDILAQQMVAAAPPGERWGEDDCSRWCAARTPIATWRARISTRCSKCSPKASPPRAAAAARTCIATRVNRSRARRGAARG